jgi:hypothetical protein
MTDHKNPDDITTPATTDEGEYTDVETEEGRSTHEDDVEPGGYTDVDRGDGTTR